MTKEQREICKIIIKEKYLNRILEKCEVGDYMDLQYVFEDKRLVFTDDNMDEKTMLSLSTPLQEEYENEQRLKRAEVRSWIAIVLSVLALLVSVFSL